MRHCVLVGAYGIRDEWQVAAAGLGLRYRYNEQPETHVLHGFGAAGAVNVTCRCAGRDEGTQFQVDPRAGLAGRFELRELPARPEQRGDGAEPFSSGDADFDARFCFQALSPRLALAALSPKIRARLRTLSDTGALSITTTRIALDIDEAIEDIAEVRALLRQIEGVCTELRDPPDVEAAIAQRLEDPIRGVREQMALRVSVRQRTRRVNEIMRARMSVECEPEVMAHLAVAADDASRRLLEARLGDAEQALAAARGLGVIGDARSGTALLERFERAPTPLRIELLGALARVGHLPARSCCLALLDDRDAALRAAACRALGELGEPGDIARLSSLRGFWAPKQEARAAIARIQERHAAAPGALALTAAEPGALAHAQGGQVALNDEARPESDPDGPRD